MMQFRKLVMKALCEIASEGIEEIDFRKELLMD